MKPINVGISINIQEGGSIWNSGLNMNLAFLVLLLRKVPGIGEVFLLYPGDATQIPAGFGFDLLGVRLARPEDVTHDVGLVIEMGCSLPVEWMRHVRALGTKIVTFLVGHSYPAQGEVPIFDRPGGPAFVGTPWHEIWTLPQYEKSSVPLLRTVGRVPVHLMPHIWSPLFLARQVAELEQAGHAFGFRPAEDRSRGWRLAIFEPNISVAKTCYIPMLACDHAYRSNREAVDLMMVMNSFQMKDHPAFNSMAAHLDLTRDSKASYEGRLPFAQCMAAHRMDAVVTHQWENAQNYLYYDALWGGYPLVHNSPYLEAEGMGFYYPGFEARKGGDALLGAWSLPAEYWGDYKSKAAAYLRTLAPDADANVQAFASRVHSLFGGQR